MGKIETVTRARSEPDFLQPFEQPDRIVESAKTNKNGSHVGRRTRLQ